MGTDGVRASIHPLVRDAAPGWENIPGLRERVVDALEKTVLRCDTPHSLAATSLVTNAYLYTGDEKYRQWVLRYVEGWMDRVKLNGGIIPDNVGWGGKAGEYRGGQWWGGMYGWGSYIGYKNLFQAITAGAENALLLTGDMGYLDLIRSQINVLLERGKQVGDPSLPVESEAPTLKSKKNKSAQWSEGELLCPSRHGAAGWSNYAPLKVKEAVHVWSASMAKSDYDLVSYLRDGDRASDWNSPP